MKFGGTSVGSAERIAGVADRVREGLARRPVVVVSALARVTDLLIRAAQSALDGGADWQIAAVELASRHGTVVSELVPAGPLQDRLLSYVDSIVSELRGFLTAVQSLGELTPRTLDAIAAVGERLSFEIVAAAAQARGIPAQAVDARALIVTDESFPGPRKGYNPRDSRMVKIYCRLERE